MSRFITWKNEELNSASVADPDVTFTVFNEDVISEKDKVNLQKYLHQRETHSFNRLTSTFLWVALTMTIFAYVREFYLPVPPLLQFTFNLLVVISSAYLIHKEGNYKFTEQDIGNFDILDASGVNVTLSGEDNTSLLENRMIQVFFGFLIALSFFFTQTTTTLKIDCPDINKTERH